MNNEKEPSQILDNLLFPKVFQTFRMAIQPTKLIIAFMAVVTICLAGWVMDLASNSVVATSSYAQGTITELQIYMTEPDQLPSFIETHKEKAQRTGVFSTLWHFASEKFRGTVSSVFEINPLGVVTNIAEIFKSLLWAFKYHYIYCVIFFILKLAIISIAGGGICRIAALQFAKGEKPGFTESLRFSLKKFISFFTTPLAPIGIIIFLGLFVFVLGLFVNIPWAGELVMIVFMALALLAGALIAVVLIGTVGGFNLMFPAIAYENSDCFDAISRSFSYVYAKPWRMVFYTAVAAVYGAICYWFVRLFAFLLLSATHLSLQFGVWVNNSSDQVNKLEAIWPGPKFTNLLGSSALNSANWSEWFAAHVVQIFLLIIIGLVVSFIISFYFSANTIIYSLMRKSVDNTALDDVSTVFEDKDIEIEQTTSEADSEHVQKEQEPKSPTESSEPSEQ